MIPSGADNGAGARWRTVRVVAGFGVGWTTYAGRTFPHPAELEWTDIVRRFVRLSQADKNTPPA